MVNGECNALPWWLLSVQCLLRKHKACSLPLSSCGRKGLRNTLGFRQERANFKAECYLTFPCSSKPHHSTVVSCTWGRMPWAGRRDKAQGFTLRTCCNITIRCFAATYMEVPCLLIPLCLSSKWQEQWVTMVWISTVTRERILEDYVHRNKECTWSLSDVQVEEHKQVSGSKKTFQVSV